MKKHKIRCFINDLLIKYNISYQIYIIVLMAIDKSKIVALFVFAYLAFSFQEDNQQSEIQVIGSDCSTDCCRTLPDRSPMTYTYYQKTGRFVGGSGDYKIDTHGYSGQGKGYLNPDE